MQRIAVANGICDILDGKLGHLQKLCRLDHPVVDEEFLGCLTQCLTENSAEVTTVKAALCGNVLYRDIVLKVLLDERQRLSHIEILNFPVLSDPKRYHGAGEIIKEEKSVP